MTAKNFMVLRIVVAIIISATTASAIQAEKYLIPIPVVLIGAALLYLSKKSVKTVLEDERDFELAGKAARYSIFTFAFLAVGAVFALLSFRHVNPHFEAISSTLSYSVCFLLMMYSLIFKYMSVKDGSGRRRIMIIASVAILAFLLIMSGIRILSGEDSWICENGNWIKHGQPDFPAPTAPCE